MRNRDTACLCRARDGGGHHAEWSQMKRCKDSQRVIDALANLDLRQKWLIHKVTRSILAARIFATAQGHPGASLQQD